MWKEAEKVEKAKQDSQKKADAAAVAAQKLAKETEKKKEEAVAREKREAKERSAKEVWHLFLCAALPFSVVPSYPFPHIADKKAEAAKKKEEAEAEKQRKRREREAKESTEKESKKRAFRHFQRHLKKVFKCYIHIQTVFLSS